eukprot:snap_masked-scaffold_26-processed-gene-4.103-mRNA-1 protein AED:1.00 eAED:1.00 QI:0/-1/0/0/-1/1/1/0/509
MRRPFNVTSLGKRCTEFILSDFLYLSKREGYILTLIVSLSRLTMLHRCKKVKASEVVKALWIFHAHYELADDFVLISDKGSHFLNQVVTEFVKESGGSQRFSCAYAPFTNGATEVQNRQILKHFRTFISELALTAENWPILLDKVQYFLNSVPMRSRGNLSPFQIFSGKMPCKDVLGRTGVLDLTEKQEKTLEESTKEVQKDILAYQEKAFEFAQRAREYQNALYNKRFKLTPLCFSEGEFVLVSKAIKHEKLKPQWVGPYIVKKQLSEHLYEVATITGKTMEVHSSRIIFFPPSEFLPNPGTKITFLNDSRKLEVKRFRGIKEEAGGFLLKVEWGGFSNERDWTCEPLNIMFEDLPKLVMKYLAEENTREMNEAKRYLKVAYPNGWKWEAVNIARFQVKGMEATRVTCDLDGKWVELGWTIHQALLLKNLAMHFGFANYDEILEYMPGRNRQQTYNKLQTWVNVQAIGDYTNLRLDLEVVRRRNIRCLGEEYKVERKIRSVSELMSQK